MSRFLQFALLLALALLRLAANAQDTLAASIAAVYGNGVTPAQVELAAGAALSCENVPLRLTNASRVSAVVMQVTVQCQKPGTLPVIAWVRSSEFPQTSPRATKAAARISAEPPLIKAGAHAILELRKQGMLITLPVVTLGPGRTGETVRVMDTTGRLRYRATVISADLLRAELQ